jgi:hypothetical protein
MNPVLVTIKNNWKLVLFFLHYINHTVSFEFLSNFLIFWKLFSVIRSHIIKNGETIDRLIGVETKIVEALKPQFTISKS